MPLHTHMHARTYTHTPHTHIHTHIFLYHWCLWHAEKTARSNSWPRETTTQWTIVVCMPRDSCGWTRRTLLGEREGKQCFLSRPNRPSCDWVLFQNAKVKVPSAENPELSKIIPFNKKQQPLLYQWRSLCTLYLHTCQVRVIVGDWSLLLCLCHVFRN